jgi:protein ImuA
MQKWNATRLQNTPELPWDMDFGGVVQDLSADKAHDGAATAFVAAMLARRSGSVMWVQDRFSRQQGGRLYETGLYHRFDIGGPILRVEVSHPRDALYAMEEAAACAALSAVVGEVDGRSSALDLTATRRLALRAKASGVTVWLIRSGEANGPSAARMRWRLASVPSLTHPHDAQAPGAPCWSAELVRATGRGPGMWNIFHERAPHDRIRLVSGTRDESLAPPVRARAGAAA